MGHLSCLENIINDSVRKSLIEAKIDSSNENFVGAYANIALSLETIAKEIKKEIKNARGINGTITMADISPMFGVLENQINNSLSQVTNQRISIILDKNFENVS